MTTPLLDSNGKLNGESIRYVAIGDSFTEGVGDVDPRRPNGVRGWADRVAAAIGSVDPEAVYANLAIRGRLTGRFSLKNRLKLLISQHEFQRCNLSQVTCRTFVLKPGE